MLSATRFRKTVSDSRMVTPAIVGKKKEKQHVTYISRWVLCLSVKSSCDFHLGIHVRHAWQPGRATNTPRRYDRLFQKFLDNIVVRFGCLPSKARSFGYPSEKRSDLSKTFQCTSTSIAYRCASTNTRVCWVCRTREFRLFTESNPWILTIEVRRCC